MSETLSIDTVKAEFDLWRKQKKSPQCRAPDALRQKALALRAHYSDKDIVKALGISHYRLTSWDSAPPAKSTAPKKLSPPQVKPEFVKLTLDEPIQSASPGELCITCEQINGSRWQLQGCLSAQQLSAFVSALNSQGGRP